MLLTKETPRRIMQDTIPADNITEIPNGNWLVCFNKMTGYYLKEMDPFTLPEKVYGDQNQVVDRYIKAFETWDKNLGILLTGLKGTGKSLMARQLCVKAEKPVLVITEPYHGTDFLSFLSTIHQEAIIFMDEFEKVYSEREHQEGLLSILDGVFHNKFMFVMTTNTTKNMNSYLMNRPSRIHYRRDYGPLSYEMVSEICMDKLNDTSKADDIATVSELIGESSFDIINRIIMEVNLFPEHSVMESVAHMNIDVAPIMYDVAVLFNGKPVTNSYDPGHSDHPLHGTANVCFNGYLPGNKQWDEWMSFENDAERNRAYVGKYISETSIIVNIAALEEVTPNGSTSKITRDGSTYRLVLDIKDEADIALFDKDLCVGKWEFTFTKQTNRGYGFSQFAKVF